MKNCFPMKHCVWSVLNGLSLCLPDFEIEPPKTAMFGGGGLCMQT